MVGVAGLPGFHDQKTGRRQIICVQQIDHVPAAIREGDHRQPHDLCRLRYEITVARPIYDARPDDHRAKTSRDGFPHQLLRADLGHSVDACRIFNGALSATPRGRRSPYTDTELVYTNPETPVA